MNIKETIKIFLKNFSNKFSVVNDVTNEEEFLKTKKWVKKARKLFRRYTIISIIIAMVLAYLTSIVIHPALAIFLDLIYLITFELSGLGCATIKLYFKEVKKSAWQAAKFGYQVGEHIQSTEVNVTHEFGNTYKISSRTTNRGLLFAIICASAILISWAFFCCYKGSFLTIKKIKLTKQKLEEYING